MTISRKPLKLVWLIVLSGLTILPVATYAQSSGANQAATWEALAPDSVKVSRLQKKILRKAKREQRALEKKLKKQLKKQEDSIKHALKELWQASPTARQIDSVKNVINNPKETIKQEVVKTAEYKKLKEEFEPQVTVYEENKDKLALLKADSATIANEIKDTALKELNNTREAKRIKEDLKPYIDSPFLKGIKLQDLDSMSTEDLQELRQQVYKNVEEHYVQKMLERQEFIQFNKEKAEMEALMGLPEAYRKQFEAYKNGEQIKNEALVKAVQEAQKVLAEHMPQVNQAQQQLAKLKKKYTAVPDANDLSTATKRNSLKGKPLKSRLVLGGNFQVVTAEPVIIDISPVLGYRFNKDFHIAIGGTYRARFSSADSTFIRTNFGRDELTYGYRAFANYRFWKVFYVHAEYERMSKEFAVTGTDRFERQWKPGALAGIGSSYKIKGAVKGDVSLLYNFLHDDKQRVYQSPWVFRFGVKLNLE